MSLTVNRVAMTSAGAAEPAGTQSRPYYTGFEVSPIHSIKMSLTVIRVAMTSAGAAEPAGTQSRPYYTGFEVSPVLSAIITVPPIFSYVSDGVAVPTPSEASPQLHSNAADWI